MPPLKPIAKPIAGFANWRELDPAIAQRSVLELGNAERRRLAGIADEPSRLRFIAARLLARRLLRHCDPDRPDWELAAEGAPQVLNQPRWHLSLSHSGDWVAAAVGSQAIGIDIEHSLRPRRYLAIARHYFHASEADALEQGPEQQRLRRFLYQWTAREAYLKALGTGIAGGLLRLRVDFDSDDRPRVQLCDGGSGWRFAYHHQTGLTACVAWRGDEIDIRRWHWRTDDPHATR